MQRPLQIAFKGMGTSPALEALIRQRVDHLETLYPRLTGCRVVVEIPHRASETGKVPIAVSVEVDIPGRAPVIGKDEQERREAKQDHTAALNNAFEAVDILLIARSILPGHADIAVHGFRSTFSDWRGEETEFPEDRIRTRQQAMETTAAGR